ncbi:MAG: sodium-dependent transporter [Candidatus Binatia bacterium]|nr:sodium-dependent transporter [Candidatus Binatia bacterium]
MEYLAPTKRGKFRSNLGFILAASGSAVGLGNIWKFPYIAGEYGGGAFVLVYLACIAVVGLPLLYAEMIIGRRGGSDVLGSLQKLTEASGWSGRLVSATAGAIAVASGFFILSFYSVVAGWALHYLAISLQLAATHPDGAAATFEALASDRETSALWHSIFMVMVVGVIAGGVQQGIERTCKVLMPALMVILLGLLGYVAAAGGLDASAGFLFQPDFSKITADAVLEALGHAFFTLSLGMGAMMTYGSYLDSDAHLIRDQFAIAFLDTTIAIVSGLVIFAVVFAMGATPGAGPGLVFITLPGLFAEIPGGAFVAIAFFALLVLAAWSSGISLLEVVVAVAVDRFSVPRPLAAVGVGIAVWILGMFSAFDGAFLDFMDNLTTRYMLPVVGLLIAIAAGWLVSKEDREAGFRALPGGGVRLAAVWTFSIRWITPTLVVLVILHGLKIL